MARSASDHDSFPTAWPIGNATIFVSSNGLSSELDGIDFDANLKAVEPVQDEEMAIARHLIREHGLTTIYTEGLTPETMPHLALRLRLLKDFEDVARDGGADAESRRMQRELTLEIGAPGRLLHTGEIEKVMPLKDAGALPFE
jgi:hypothetical protein